MRILYVHYLLGRDTAHHHVRQFVSAARSLGHDVEEKALHLTDSNGEVSASAPTLTTRLLAATRKQLARYLHDPKELLWNRRYLRREQAAIREAKPDVLLVRDHTLNFSYVHAARREGVPLVVEMNASAALELSLFPGPYFHLPGVAGWVEGWKLRRADGITVVSTALKERLVAEHRLNPDLVAVVPNGADIELFQPRSYGGGSTEEPLIGFVGSFQKFHGADLLAAMAEEVGRLRPKARFLFVGDGPDLESVKAATSKLGERARFTGRVPHQRVPELVAELDIGVVADAGFYMSPLKVIEWMAAGVAVVAPAYGPLEEVIDDGVEGLLFEPRDRDALVQSVLRLVDDPQLRSRLGQAATARVRDSLTWRHNAGRVLATCQEAIDHRRSPVSR